MILPTPTWQALMCHMRGYHLQSGTACRVSPYCMDCGALVVWTLPTTATTGAGRTGALIDGTPHG
jgi:hypothetical protein